MTTFHALLQVTILVTFAAICAAQKDFYMEEPCARVGGICLAKDECSQQTPTKYLGLCPRQRKEGAECCHGYSTKEYRCRKLGGECFPKSEACREGLRIPKARDCSSDSVCCMLL